MVSSEITLVKGETRRGLELKLLAAGKVRIRFAGKKSMMAVIRAQYEGEAKNVDPVFKMLMNQGGCTLTGLRPGKWKFMLSGMGGTDGGEAEKSVEVKAGETTRVTIER